MWVLGLALSHDGAACLFHDGVLYAAIQEERLSRQRHAVLLGQGGSERAIGALLEDAGIGADALALVACAPLGSRAEAMEVLRGHPELGGRPQLWLGHHEAHAWSAYAAAGWGEAVVLVVDGAGSLRGELGAAAQAVTVGEGRETVSIYRATPEGLEPLHKQCARLGVGAGRARGRLGEFGSLGLMYQQVARLSFGGIWDAGKVMGLAPYGVRRWPTEAFLTVHPGGILQFEDGLAGIGGQLPQVGPYPEAARVHADLAASVQGALEDGVMALVAQARALGGGARLLLAGGVFLNGVLNTKIRRSGLFKEVFVMPAAHDAGGAIGAAFEGSRRVMAGQGRRVPSGGLGVDFLGPRPVGVAEALAAYAGRVRVAPGGMAAAVACLEAGGAVGIYEGRSEFGARALGHRSIVCDARRGDAALRLNQYKGREGFRPVAAAVLEGEVGRYFEWAGRSPFMSYVVPVREERREEVPGIVHVDGSASLQTVGPEVGALWGLLEAFYRRTGCPVLANTSFNAAGEVMVERPEEALEAFLAMGLDGLWLEGHWVSPI